MTDTPHTGTYLIAFKSICNFINNLSAEYGKKHKSLKLYNRLINKTQISHDQVIKKHISLFQKFCSENREALATQSREKLVEKKITYSDRVYVDMDLILGMADKETSSVIWKHLLTISAIVDPAGKAKEILRKNAEDGKAGPSESNFLADIISKVEKNISPDANPMEAVSSIMQSGIFTDLMAGMQSGLSNGQLDMGKLLGAVQGMMANMGEQAGDDPEAKNAMGMISNLMGTMTAGGPGAGGNPPDMMQMMTTMMSGMGGGMGAPRVSSIQEEQARIEEVVNTEKDQRK